MRGIANKVMNLVWIIRQIEELLTAVEGVEDVFGFPVAQGVPVIFF